MSIALLGYFTVASRFEIQIYHIIDSHKIGLKNKQIKLKLKKWVYYN